MRALRPAPGKVKARIFDHGGVFVRMGHPTQDELELVLDDGKRKKAGNGGKREKLPNVCSNCSIMKPTGVHKCPSCGFAPEKRNTATVEQGELEVMQPKKRAKLEDKQRVYSMLLRIRQERIKNGKQTKPG